MSFRRSLAYFDLAPGLLAYLRRRPGLEEAREAVKARLASRGESFLALVERGVYGHAASPYRRLLEAAGVSRERLRALVLRDGVEAALIALRDAGVRLSADEVRGRAPVRRPGLELEIGDGDLDNPARTGGVGGRSSGTSNSGAAKGVSVVYDWAFLALEAENEQLLYDCHGVSDAPTALWYPVHVSIAGIHNLLLDLRRGRPPEKWFSQAPERGLRDTAMRWAIGMAARAGGMRAPAPEDAPASEALRVAQWMHEAARRHGQAVVRTFASSAVRAVQAGVDAGLDLRGCTVFAGGEPLGDAGAAMMRRAGVRAVPRFVATEPGLVAAACPLSAERGAMHVYLDRIALIPAPDGEGLLVTTLTPSAGRILINASLGDRGTLEECDCGCSLGELGLRTFVRGVRSETRFTQQGMAVDGEALEDIVAEIVREAGGAETDFQLWDQPGGRLSIAVDPRLGALDEQRLITTVLERLETRDAGGPVAAAVWRGAGALKVVRAAPRLTAGQKLRRRISVE